MSRRKRSAGRGEIQAEVGESEGTNGEAHAQVSRPRRSSKIDSVTMTRSDQMVGRRSLIPPPLVDVVARLRTLGYIKVKEKSKQRKPRIWKSLSVADNEERMNVQRCRQHGGKDAC